MNKMTNVFESRNPNSSVSEISIPDVQIPQIVLDAVNQTYEQIVNNLENSHTINSSADSQSTLKQNAKSNSFIKHKKMILVASICLCVLLTAGITTAAATHFKWSEGMTWLLKSNDIEQQTLTDQGYVAQFPGNTDYSHYAVTDHNITYTPNVLVTDGTFFYVSFLVTGEYGYTRDMPGDPIPAKMRIYLGDDPNSEESWLNATGMFYNGIIENEDGSLSYQKGYEINDGNVIKDDILYENYINNDGAMEYIIQGFLPNPDDTLEGKILHIEFSDIKVEYKMSEEICATGTWNFEFNLPTTPTPKTIKVSQDISSSYKLDSIELSPISIRLNITSSGNNYSENLPMLDGVILTDGTRLARLTEGGARGNYSEDASKMFLYTGFNQVVNPNEVAGLIFVNSETGERFDIEILK